MAENDALRRWLDEQRSKIYEELKGITDAAGAENRDLSADEAARFDKGSADMDSIAQRTAQLRAVDEANAQAEEFLTRALGKDVDVRGGQTGDQDLNAELRRLASDPAVGFVDVQSRALGLGATTGGTTVPTTLYSQLQQHLVEVSGLLSAGPTVWNTASGESFDVPKTTSHGAAGGLLAPGSDIAAASTDPAFTKATLGAYKFAQIIDVPRELIDDTAVDLLPYIAKAAGRNCGLKLAPYLITGTGSSQPGGIITGATLGVTGGTGVTGAFTYDNLVDLYHSVIAPYRNSPSCAWLMKDSSLAAVRKLKDGSGQYIFAPGVAGEPDRVLGKPVYTDFSVTAIGLGAKSLLFGDISAYWVRFAGGARFDRSDDFKFGSDTVSFRAVIRADGVLVDQTGAVKYFAGGAS